MTRTVLAASLAAALGLGAMAPAHAGGSFSLSIAPRDARSDDAIRTGLQIYSLFNDIRGGASVRQKGNRNSAGLRQDGRRNPTCLLESVVGTARPSHVSRSNGRALSMAPGKRSL